MILIFLFSGLFIGSFLNMLIDRLPREEQVFTGRSHCDKCHKPIAWYDLIPVISWILLHGRCRWCRKKIPARNVVVELTTGFLFVTTHIAVKQFNNLTIQQFNNGIFDLITQNLVFEGLSLVIVSCLIVIFFVDLKHRIIPDSMTVIAALAAIGLYLVEGSGSPIPYLLSSSGAAGFFVLLILITKGRGMGWGDVKFVAFMGLFLGFPGTLIALYIAFLTGAFVSVILILRGRKKFGQTIAFGPFLVVGTLIAHFNLLRYITLLVW